MLDINVVKKNIQFQELLRENNTTSIIKNEYLIPDTHPDVKEILLVEAKPVILNKEILADKIMVEGKIEYNVIYIPREDSMVVNSVRYFEKFTNYLDNNDGEHKIVCEAECKVEHIESRVMNERKIELEAVVNLIWEINKGIEFDFVEDIEGGDEVQVLKKTESVNRLASSKDIELLSKSMIRVGMDKPEILKILKCTMMLHKREIRVGEEKVNLGCYCKINILYLGAESREIIPLEEDVYMSKEEEVLGVSTNMIPFVIYEIENSDLELEEDDLGEKRVINLECLVKVNVKVFSNESIDVIEDAYSTKFPIELTNEDYKIGVIQEIKSVESIVKDNIYLKEGDKKPEHIISVIGNVIIMNKTLTKDKLIVEGIINVNVMYKTGDEEKAFAKVEGDIPFISKIDINGIDHGMKAIVKCNLESIDAIIEANTIAIKSTLEMGVKISSEINKNFISDIKEAEGEVPKKKASISIYVIGKGDTLWKLAKEYCTTVEELIKINTIEEPEIITEGDKILVPGRANF